MILLNGKELAQQRFLDLKLKLSSSSSKPKLVGILVGNNSASQVYVNYKKKACKKLGALCDILCLDEQISQKKLLQIITDLNKDNSVTGILLQLPLPPHLDSSTLVNAISPSKDVDGITAENLGLLLQKSSLVAPCTAKGILTLLKNYKIELQGAQVVVIGRSLIVGLPVFILLQQHGATVSLCHSFTKNLKNLAQKADIIIIAVGKKYFLDKTYFKKNAVVVDVGISREDGKLYGDVCPDHLSETLKAYTPVPGGVGPMTIQSLMENLVCLHAQKKV